MGACTIVIIGVGYHRGMCLWPMRRDRAEKKDRSV